MPPVEQKLFRTDDPDLKCSHPKCPYQRADGADFCVRHGANSQLQAQEKGALRNYKIQKYQQRLSELNESPNIKCLRDEIAILRMLVEEQINACDTTLDLMAKTPIIVQLVDKLTGVIGQCHKLDIHLRKHLDSEDIIKLGDATAEIAIKYVDPDKIVEFSQELLEAFEDATTDVRRNDS